MKKIEFVPSTCLPPLVLSDVRKFEQWLLRNGYGQGRLRFDSSYIEHMLKWNGGVPFERSFTTSSGAEFSIERFLHFGSFEQHKTLEDYEVEVAWSQASDRLGPFLMPFAELSFGDMLCFDYSSHGRPSVVVWLHEESVEDSPKTEFVASTFDEFLELIHS